MPSEDAAFQMAPTTLPYFDVHVIGLVGVIPWRSIPLGMAYNFVPILSVQSMFLATRTGWPSFVHKRRVHIFHPPQYFKKLNHRSSLQTLQSFMIRWMFSISGVSPWFHSVNPPLFK